jgi:hypothetical protein
VPRGHATDASGTKSCYFPAGSTMECANNPGNANCYGERYASVCPCVVKPLDQACTCQCPPGCRSGAETARRPYCVVIVTVMV